MIESGLVVAIGLVFMFTRLSWRTRLWVLSHPLLLDVCVFLLVNWLHGGTAIGAMTAAVAALVCSALLTVGRKLFGYRQRGIYIPGALRRVE